MLKLALVCCVSIVPSLISIGTVFHQRLSRRFRHPYCSLRFTNYGVAMSSRSQKSSLQSFPSTNWRFCRASPTDSSRPYLTDPFVGGRFPDARTIRVPNIDRFKPKQPDPILQNCVLQVQANGEPIIVNPEVRLVLYRQNSEPSVIKSGAFGHNKALIGAGLLFAFFCFVGISGYLVLIETLELTRGRPVEQAIKEVDPTVRYSVDTTPAILEGGIQRASEKQVTRRIDEKLARLETLLTARSPTARLPDTAVSRETPLTVQAEEYHFDPSIGLIPGAVVHRKATGEADYWLVAREGEAIGSRVIPYAVTPLGVAVHGVDDYHNYILTQDGRWANYD
jgi:hypothetical protein